MLSQLCVVNPIVCNEIYLLRAYMTLSDSSSAAFALNSVHCITPMWHHSVATPGKHTPKEQL
jgi:hypothetical protein